MNKLVITILGCLLTLTVFAEDVNRTVDASSDGHVDISNIAGSVTVRGWTRDAVEVTGTLGRNVKELIIERDGDKVFIKVKIPRQGGRGIDSELHINVPKNSSLNVGTVSADIEITDITGRQRLHTVSGDVDTEHAGGDLSAESVSGDIEIVGDHAEGDVKAGTVSGDVTVFRVSGEIEANSVSGDVVLDEGSFIRAILETVNGEILFDSELREGGKLSVDTINGDVEIEFSTEVSADFDVDTFNGDIRSCFGPKAERTSKYAPGWELVFTEGDGDGRFTVSTLNGDISVCDQ